ncbi:DMT family transporter [Shewanella sp. Isolate8]|uniref:DMT family transporter n=1 Tax=Shewanella sp. Isolate8 TaxID=2908529 RepID=UPI001EFE6394|nr:DMT family transporter [Shewanella sp. Isolate8]MCG9747613.1 DMT family transporter [Shewanella sp. Isolate8]
MPELSRLRLLLLTSVTMLAFAANSLFCREALATDSIDAASFTLIRIASGALVLGLIASRQIRASGLGGNWLSAAALFGYAVAFSFAYNSLSAGTGALLLFGAVQITMILYGLWAGERINRKQVLGAMLAGGGLVWLVLPGVSAPPLLGAVLMIIAGVSWGIYSLLGRGTKRPTLATAGNFIRAVPMALLPLVLLTHSQNISITGIGYAVASGALASGLGYALWYSVLPSLSALTAATVQLSVPVIAAFGGFIWLGEAMTTRLLVASIAVLGGIALFVMSKQGNRASNEVKSKKQ